MKKQSFHYKFKSHVLTPGGWKLKKMVAKLDENCFLDHMHGDLKCINKNSGKTISHFKLKESLLKDIPLLPKSENISRNYIRRKVFKVKQSFAQGWIGYGEWQNTLGIPITSFQAEWTVPLQPSTKANQTIFLFNGIQNSQYILQPVLQWGKSFAGGGNYWSISNWYAASSASGTFCKGPVRVEPGQKMKAEVTCLVGSEGNHYTSKFIGFPAIDLEIRNVAELLWANIALEAYTIKDCSAYPSDKFVEFQNVQLKVDGSDFYPQWISKNRITDCGQHVVIQDNQTPKTRIFLYMR